MPPLLRGHGHGHGTRTRNTDTDLARRLVAIAAFGRLSAPPPFQSSRGPAPIALSALGCSGRGPSAIPELPAVPGRAAPPHPVPAMAKGLCLNGCKRPGQGAEGPRKRRKADGGGAGLGPEVRASARRCEGRGAGPAPSQPLRGAVAVSRAGML